MIRQQLDQWHRLEPGQALLVAPLPSREAQHASHHRKSPVDRTNGYPVVLQPLPNELLQRAVVDPVQRKIADERIYRFQIEGIPADAAFVQVLIQATGCRFPERPFRPNPENNCLAYGLDPVSEYYFSFGESARSSAFAKSAKSSELLVDVQVIEGMTCTDLTLAE